MEEFIVGQRWINSAELALGLGTIIAAEHRTITVEFPATGDTRTFAKQTSPLNRVSFSEGDQIEIQDGQTFIVIDSSEKQGLITYHCEDELGAPADIHELLLSHHVQLSRPSERLLNQQIDRNAWFKLRVQARHYHNQLVHSDLHGLTGCRTSLIPHQLYIAHEVAHRHAPRVLLADEVGLGKTIEAGLILHHQLLTERAKRILIIVPESLVHQWLVEMLRRFNLMFSIFDAARCEPTDENSQENPFHSAQLALCSLDFLNQHPNHYQQALQGDWDLLVVDEAHHLLWSENYVSPEYEMIEQLSLSTRGVLLLTATPEQIGKESHFARLRLLDPDRFSDLNAFLEEERHYQPIAAAVEALMTDQPLPEAVQALVNDSQDIELTDDREHITSQLLDRHGTGRILFRNTRATVQGFPERKVIPYPLTCPDAYCGYQEDAHVSGQALLSPDWRYRDTHPKDDWTLVDPRVDWLKTHLQQLKAHKVLVIAAHMETALDLAEALRARGDIHSAVFHEGMSLIERDRAAAYFSDEFGTQVLVCSEIGSEGRNFQFAHQMVLFDLPLNPDLLEQRIGRLDRIGQTETIQIHVPYLEQSPQALFFHWCHEGIDAFEQTCPAGHTLFEEFESELMDALKYNEENLGDLLIRTKERQKQLHNELHNGRDKLLEYNSCRQPQADELHTRADNDNQETDIAEFMEIVFDAFGIHSEPHSQHCLIIKPSDHMQAPIPGLSEEGMTVTYQRATALAFEDVHFITWEHPLITNILDNILSQEMGNVTVTAIEYDQVAAGTLLLETHYVLETAANQSLQVSRYLPATTIKLMVDENGKQHPDLTHDFINENRISVNLNTAKQIIQAKTDDIKTTLALCSQLAGEHAPALIKQAQKTSQTYLNEELDRLRALQQVNPNVRPEELTFFERQLEQVSQHLASTRPRLDAVRVIVAT